MREEMGMMRPFLTWATHAMRMLEDRTVGSTGNVLSQSWDSFLL